MCELISRIKYLRFQVYNLYVYDLIFMILGYGEQTMDSLIEEKAGKFYPVVISPMLYVCIY